MTPDESIAALKELLLAEVAGLRTLIVEKDGRYADLVNIKMQGCLDVLKEKDALYTDRDTARQKAVEAALKAAQTGVDAAFAASEKAIGKSDQNAEKWRENANEWRAAMMDRETKFASKSEVDNEFRSVRTELGSLSLSRAEGAGARVQSTDTRTNWLAILSLLGFLIVAIGFVLKTGAAVPPTAPQVIYVPAPAGSLLPTSPPAAVPGR
jgi:hypothetical protein